MISFGAWEPDKFGLESSFPAEAKNVYAGLNSYKPMPSLDNYEAATLPATAKGLAFARGSDGSWKIFCGTSTKLYEYQGGAWVDRTRTVGGDYNVPDGERWSFAQFGNRIIACNYTDAPQYLDLTSGTNFAALPGSPPTARLVRAVGDFVFLAALSGDQNKIHWSGINDSEQWSSITALSDTQTFPGGGHVMGVHGDKTGFILQEMAVKSFEFQPGSEYVFAFAEVEGAKGCIAPYAHASVGGTVFYLSDDGFYSIGPNGLNPIGAHRVNKWYQDNSDQARVKRTMCIADPYHPRIFWAFYATSASTVYDRLLIYDWQIDRWSWSDEEAVIWASLATPGKTLDQLDAVSASIDALTTTLDSVVWMGNKPTFGAINSTGGLAFLSGSNQAATVTTAEGRPNPTGVAFTSAVRPLADTNDVTLRIGYRNRLGDAVTWTGSHSVNSIGLFDTRVSAMLQRYELSFAAGATWTHAQGVEPEAVPDGVR